MTTPSFVLVPSPIVGPGSLSPTVAALNRMQADARLATVSKPGLAAPAWTDCAALVHATTTITPDDILVGHSASGVIIAELATMAPVRGLIFLDAAIPPDSGHAQTGDEQFRQFMTTVPVRDGAYPPWSRWWGDDALRGLIPEADDFDAFEADLPIVPTGWFNSAIQLKDWTATPAGYLETSAMFAPETAKAAARKWPTRKIDGSHLHAMLRPEETAKALMEIASEL